MIFSFITKNLNLETKNLVIFKRWDGVKADKFWYYEGSQKNLIFKGEGGGGCHEKPIYMGELPKKGWLGQGANLRGAWQKRWEWCFWGGSWYPNAHNAEGVDWSDVVITLATCPMYV